MIYRLKSKIKSYLCRHFKQKKPNSSQLSVLPLNYTSKKGVEV
jgi:hypothetical protein